MVVRKDGLEGGSNRKRTRQAAVARLEDIKEGCRCEVQKVRRSCSCRCRCRSWTGNSKKKTEYEGEAKGRATKTMRPEKQIFAIGLRMG